MERVPQLRRGSAAACGEVMGTLYVVKSFRCIFCLAFVVCATGVANADLGSHTMGAAGAALQHARASDTGGNHAASDADRATVAEKQIGLARAHSTDLLAVPYSGVSALLLDGYFDRQISFDLVTNETMREIRPAPSSLSLFLSAILSVGGWHFVRSARNLHLGAMPEWYHTGAPAQIGHTTAFDLDFGSIVLCRIQEPNAEPPALVLTAGRDETVYFVEQSSPTTAAPRGPPLFA